VNIFHISEIVELGIQKEIKRRDFYAQAAQAFDDAVLKKIFSQLRDWEETHIKKFTLIRDKIEEPSPAESFLGELNSYMEIFVDEKLYNDVSLDNFRKNISSPLIAIKYGIEFEKDAIVFFTGLIPYLESSSRDVVHQLIDEERQHIVYLAKLRKQVSI